MQAGLFSAILTAFVVQSYPMLQENTGQTTNQLLSTISSQMGSAASGQSTAATGAAGSSPANPPFIPSTSARWINSLFFLALVFSLSAALFGILAKQWLREYMHWNSTLGAARENVLIRQLRYEALGDWHVAATISSIPALLEVAMIMFFIGIVILLWTIDTVVAIVVTTSVAAFLGLVAAFTVLPVIFRRCPYKSPTAWACFVLCHLVSATVAYTGRFAAAYVQNLRHGHWQLHNIKIRWPRRPRSWRQREELVEGLEHPHRSSFQVSEETLRGVRCALVAERVGLNGSRTLAEALPFPTSALKDVTEVSVLFRALSWVHKASQDLRVKEYVKQSMETIHVRRPENIDTLGVTNVTDWCILWSLQTGNLRRPEAALSTADSGVNAVQQNVRDMWLLERLNILGEQRNVARARQRIQYGAVNLAIPADDAPLLADLIAADLKSAVSDLLAVSVEDVKRSTFPVLGRIVLELLCVMGSMCTSRTVSVHDHHLHGIRDLVCQRESKLLVDTALPGLRSSALIIACRISNVTSNEGKLSGAAAGAEDGASFDMISSFPEKQPHVRSGLLPTHLRLLRGRHTRLQSGRPGHLCATHLRVAAVCQPSQQPTGGLRAYRDHRAEDGGRSRVHPALTNPQLRMLLPPSMDSSAVAQQETSLPGNRY